MYSTIPLHHPLLILKITLEVRLTNYQHLHLRVSTGKEKQHHPIPHLVLPIDEIFALAVQSLQHLFPRHYPKCHENLKKDIWVHIRWAVQLCHLLSAGAFSVILLWKCLFNGGSHTKHASTPLMFDVIILL